MKKRGLILTIVILMVASVAYAVVIKDDVLYTGTVTYVTQPTLTTAASAWNIGSGAEADIQIKWDGNEVDWRAGIDDSANSFEIGLGTVFETTERITISNGTGTVVTLGDAVTAVDTVLVYDGNSRCGLK